MTPIASKPAFVEQLLRELHSGLTAYWQIAADLLQGSAIRLTPPSPETFTLERNFFSSLFLYSYYRCGIASERRILYTTINQCLRGMVTGCDNLLDDEYKPTLDSDLPISATRFRSVLDIMVSDRVLMAAISHYCQQHGQPAELLLQTARVSLQALCASGAQEASEEGGSISQRLPPEKVLTTIHHYKTGLLFQCTWAVPAIVETRLPPLAGQVQQALYAIGMGCQIFDDCVDLGRDLRDQRQNYVASLLLQNAAGDTTARLEKLTRDQAVEAFYHECPDLYQQAVAKGCDYLRQGLTALFFPADQVLVQPAMAFLAQRIGVQL